jgi:hypothetical protein
MYRAVAMHSTVTKRSAAAMRCADVILARAGLVREKARKDLVDLLFAFTSWTMFDQLRRGDREARAVCALIVSASDGAVAAAAPKR